MQGRLFSLRVFYFAAYAMLGAYAPFFPRWLEARGIDGLAMGATVGLLPALGLFGPPAVGILADALGLRGSLLRLTCLGAFVSVGALAALGAAGATLSFGVVFTAVFCFAIFRTPMTMLADVVTLERAREAGTTYGRVRLWGSLGFMITALVVGRVIDLRSPFALPAIIAAAIFVALASAWTLPAKPDVRRLPVAREAVSLLAAPDFAIFLGVAVFQQVAHASYDLCFSLHLRDLGASDARTGVTWAAGVVFEVVLMAFAEPLTRRVPAPRLVGFALLGGAVRWALIGWLRSLDAMLVIAPLHAVSFAAWWLGSLAFIKARAPAHALATAQGLFSAAVAAGAMMGMLAWGAVYAHAGGVAVFEAAAAVALAGALLAAIWAKRIAS